MKELEFLLLMMALLWGYNRLIVAACGRQITEYKPEEDEPCTPVSDEGICAVRGA